MFSFLRYFHIYYQCSFISYISGPLVKSRYLSVKKRKTMKCYLGTVYGFNLECQKLYSPAGGYLWYFCAIQAPKLSRFKAGYLFEGCYFGAILGSMKIAIIKCLEKYQLYSNMSPFQYPNSPLYNCSPYLITLTLSLRVSLWSCRFVDPLLPAAATTAWQFWWYYSSQSNILKIFEGELIIRTLSTTLLEIFCKFMLHSKVIF